MSKIRLNKIGGAAMNRNIPAGCLALLWISLLPLQGLDEEKTLALSLDECIARTVTNNLGLAE